MPARLNCTTIFGNSAGLRRQHVWKDRQRALLQSLAETVNEAPLLLNESGSRLSAICSGGNKGRQAAARRPGQR